MGEADGAPSQTDAGSRAAATRPPAWKRFRGWAVVAFLVAVGGVAGTAFAARSIAAGDTANSRDAFKQSSGQVASTLQLAIQREQDLVITGAGFFLGDPTHPTRSSANGRPRW